MKKPGSMEMCGTVLKTHRRVGKEALSSQIDLSATGVAGTNFTGQQGSPCKGFHPINSKVVTQRKVFRSRLVHFFAFAKSKQGLERLFLSKAIVKHKTTISAMGSFHTLPPEIVHNIFSYFTQRELCLLAQVSTAWRDFVYDPIHWQKLFFELSHNLGLEVLGAITQRTPLLKKLSLHGRENLTVVNEVSHFTKNCQQLQNIDLSYLSTVDSSVVKLVSEHCSRLHSLSLEGCVLVDYHSVAMLCQKQDGLFRLNLSGCSALADDSIQLIAQNLSKLQQVNIDGIPDITDKSIRALCEQLGPTLESLDVDGSQLTDSAIQAISKATKLQHLCVSNGTHLTDSALQYVQRLTRLQELRLRRATDMTSAGLTAMFAACSLRSLHLLDLTECSMLDDNCVQALVHCCGTSLCHLGLSLCWNVSDAGLEAIIHGCRKLHHLDLLGLDSITGAPLHKVPEVLPTLSYIDLRQCSKINDGLMVETIKKKPSLRVLNYYGEEFRQGLEAKDHKSVLMATHLQILLGFLLLELLVGLICMC